MRCVGWAKSIPGLDPRYFNLSYSYQRFIPNFKIIEIMKDCCKTVDPEPASKLKTIVQWVIWCSVGVIINISGNSSRSLCHAELKDPDISLIDIKLEHKTKSDK